MQNRYAVTFGNKNGTLESLFFPTLKDSKRCKVVLAKDWKEVYIEKKINGEYQKINS